MYYDIGGVQATAVENTASQLGSASALATFQKLLQQAGEGNLVWFVLIGSVVLDVHQKQ